MRRRRGAKLGEGGEWEAGIRKGKEGEDLGRTQWKEEINLFYNLI